MTRRTTRTGEAPRAPLERPISLRFNHFGDFVDELTANVSTGGMFVRTRSPHPVGSVFEFELRLGEESPLLSGKAQVAWVRRRVSGADQPRGMGVRFVELSDPSRRQIAELVAVREAAAGRPLEVEAPPSTLADESAPAAAAAQPAPPEGEAPPAVAASASPAPAPVPAGRAMSARAHGRRLRLPWLLLAIALLAALTAALWPPRDPAPQPGAAVEPAAPAADTAAAPAAVEPAAKPAQLRLVEDWARAWSEQRVDAYLAAYSPRFVPPPGLDRASWERQRRSRVLAPRWIDVDLALVELEELDGGRSRVRLVQAYESDSYSDVVRKTLELERTANGWKILRETVEP